MSHSRATVRSFVICCAAAVVGAGAPARAQSTLPSDAVYNDVKQIIEDLISREAAHTVTPHLACLSGRIAAATKDAGAVTFAIDAEGKTNQTFVLEATKLFPRTMQSIYDGQYGKLGPIISDEASGAVAYELYHLLTLPSLVRAVQRAAQEAEKDLTSEAKKAVGMLNAEALAVHAKKAAAAQTANAAVNAANAAVKALHARDPATALNQAAAAAAVTARAITA